MCRGNANPHSVVIARLDRATQYSREADDQTERPGRTGPPASAGDDSRVWSPTRSSPPPPPPQKKNGGKKIPAVSKSESADDITSSSYPARPAIAPAAV